MRGSRPTASPERLLVAAATGAEARLAPAGPDITVIRTGMGAEHTLAMIRPALRGISGILSFGFAGGLTGETDNGRVLLPDRIVDESGTSHPVDADWHRRTLTLLQALQPATSPLLSVATVALSPAAKAALRQGSLATAVDMESAVLAGLAAQSSLAFLVLRVVVDGPRDHIPRAARAAVAPDGRLDLPGLLGGLLRRPADLVPLLQLFRQHRRAARSLAEAVALASPALATPRGTSRRGLAQ